MYKKYVSICPTELHLKHNVEKLFMININ